MNQNLKDLLLKATQLTRAGRLAEATAAIQRALTGHAPGATPPPAAPKSDPPGRVFDMEPVAETSIDVASELPVGPIIDTPCVSTAPASAPSPEASGPGTPVAKAPLQETPLPEAPLQEAPLQEAPLQEAPLQEAPLQEAPLQEAPLHEAPPAKSPASPKPTPVTEEAFISGSHSSAGQTRDYKLYLPPDAQAKPRALVVMLHGCTQNPDDFAAGTAMNARAREQGFYVLYPAQSQSANPMRCWNWFRATDQVRGAGEPAVIVGMVQEIARDYDVDPRHIYAAGLSAGGAMAAILGAAYPDVFAAIGVHSGLAPGAASNVMAAMSVMKRGGTDPIILPPRASSDPLLSAHPAVPTIVFQGDADSTVHPRNGEQLLAAVLRGAVEAGDLTPAQADAPQVEQGRSAQGQRYVRSQFANAQGIVRAEYWQLQGAGHAWAGGLPAGTYTDAKGPDATAEMLRFFFAHAR